MATLVKIFQKIPSRPLQSLFFLGHQVVNFHLKKITKTLIIITYNEKAKQNTCAKNNDNRKNHVTKLAFHIKNFFSPYHEHNLDTMVDMKKTDDFSLNHKLFNFCHIFAAFLQSSKLAAKPHPPAASETLQRLPAGFFEVHQGSSTTIGSTNTIVFQKEE
jgi:hypothetical protein